MMCFRSIVFLSLILNELSLDVDVGTIKKSFAENYNFRATTKVCVYVLINYCPYNFVIIIISISFNLFYFLLFLLCYFIISNDGYYRAMCDYDFARQKKLYSKKRP